MTEGETVDEVAKCGYFEKVLSELRPKQMRSQACNLGKEGTANAKARK